MSSFALRGLSGLIADGADVDNSAVRAALPPSQQKAMLALARMAATVRQRSRELPIDRLKWVDRIGLGLAFAASTQVALAFGALATRSGSFPAARVPAEFQIAAMVVNFATAAVLAAIARGDPAARALAISFSGIAAAFTGVLASAPPAWVPSSLEGLWSSVLRWPGDLALVAGAWMFAFHFPRVEIGALIQRTIALLTRVAVVIAGILFLVHVWLELGGRASTTLAFDRHASQTQYWAVVFPLIALSAPFAMRKLQLGYVGARRQVRIFLLGLALGAAPVALLSLIGSTSAAGARFLRSEAVFPLATVLVFAGLLSLPVTTAAAVLAGKVLPLRLVIRRSLQYVLARQALLLAIAVPIVGAAAQFQSDRHRTIEQFLTSGGYYWLIALTFAALVAFSRAKLLRAIDALFLRTRVDARALIRDLGVASRRKLSVRDAGDALIRAVHTAFHSHETALLVRFASRDLTPLVGAAETLSGTSALARVLEASPAALPLATESGIARLLPAAELAWATRQDWHVMVPLHAEGEALVGVLCVGAPMSADSFSRDDLATLEALCSATAPWIAQRLGESAGGSSQVIGAECERCGRLFNSHVTRCDCGGTIVGSMLPPRIGNRFVLRRRLGRGGMGVVYAGADESLGRDVALKTLPEVGQIEAEQLRTEARTMAAVQHPNLAYVLGLETVGPLPVLVVEYLAGGTLADRLQRGPLPWSEVIDLGISLAEALRYLHDAGFLHRDLKPSNVGFTAAGHPKVLDFGVSVPVASAGRSAAAGTMLYMPPEAFAGTTPSPLFDLWSLGVVLCEAGLGVHPLSSLLWEDRVAALEAGRVWAHADDAVRGSTPPLAEVLSVMLAPEPARRFPDARTLRLSLERCRR